MHSFYWATPLPSPGGDPDRNLGTDRMQVLAMAALLLLFIH